MEELIDIFAGNSNILIIYHPSLNKMPIETHIKCTESMLRHKRGVTNVRSGYSLLKYESKGKEWRVKYRALGTLNTPIKEPLVIGELCQTTTSGEMETLRKCQIFYNKTRVYGAYIPEERVSVFLTKEGFARKKLGKPDPSESDKEKKKKRPFVVMATKEPEPKRVKKETSKPKKPKRVKTDEKHR